MALKKKKSGIRDSEDCYQELHWDHDQLASGHFIISTPGSIFDFYFNLNYILLSYSTSWDC